jgi:hypothetical protein
MIQPHLKISSGDSGSSLLSHRFSFSTLKLMLASLTTSMQKSG